MKDIYMIGNTHFDPVWLWRWEEAMASIHSTFRSALDRMKEDEDFIYSFVTPPVFEWIKQTDPEMLEEIKGRVSEGRWELPEGWWLQPDCYSASGESYARQSLYGQKYLLENFGKYSDTVFNIDSFGHNSQIPQILRKSNINNYVLCRPENKHFPIESPYFKWQGKDGSEVKAFRCGQYSEIYNKDMRLAVTEAEERMTDAECDEMLVYGVTNHGGAPTKKAISDIHELQKEKDYKIAFSSVAGYFEKQKEPTVTVNKELLTGDFGPYANGTEIKKLNKVAERAAITAEKVSVIAKRLLNRPYPKDKLDDVWKDIMFCQFHDILGGASIKEAYFDAKNQLGRAITNANEITHFALGQITRKIKMPGKNPDNPWNLTVWNLNAIPFTGYIEAEAQWLHEFPAYSGEILLEDSDGKQYKTQKVLEGSVIEGFRSRFLFKSEIPPMGYKTFKVIKTGERASVSDYKKVKTLTTGAFEITFDDKTGLIETLKCKRSGKTYKNPITPAVFSDEGDTWCFNVNGYGKQLENFKFIDVQVTEKGIHRTTVKTTHSFRSSLITLYYTFYENEEYFKLSYNVNWNEKHTVLKLICDYGCDQTLVSSPFASEARADSDRDMPVGTWLCSFEKECGVLMSSDSIFAYNKNGSKIGLTLLRSCIFGDLRLCELDRNADYKYMEQGITEGNLCIFPFTGELDAQLTDKAIAFSTPPVVICEANHDGIFESTNSFISIDADGVDVSAIKEGYDSCGEIIRLNEYIGKPKTVTLGYFGLKHTAKLNPYEIKTLKLCDGKFTEVNILEE